MAKSYDYDLRSRAISLINSGNKRGFVSDLLKISIPTLDRWINRQKKTGDVKPKSDLKTGRKKIISNSRQFTKFIQKNTHLSLSQMQDKYKEVSFMTIYRGIKDLGYSYKKNSGYIKKEIKKKEKNISKK